MGSNKAERNQHTFNVGDEVRLSKDGLLEYPSLLGRGGVVKRVSAEDLYNRGRSPLLVDWVSGTDDSYVCSHYPNELEHIPTTPVAYQGASASLDSTLIQIRQGYNLSIKDTIKLLSSAIVSLTEELE
jgi:hypothetical protein